MGFSQPSVKSPELSPAQQAFQSASANWLQGQIGRTAPPYSGQLTAPLSPQQARSIGQIGSVGQMSTGPTAQGLGTLGATAGGAYLFDPFAQAQLQSTANYARNQFMQDVPALTAPFQAAGQTGYSTPAQQYLTRQAAGFETGLANTLARQAEDIYSGGLGRMQQAAQTVVPLGLGTSQAGLQALTIPQQVQQAAIGANYNEWLRQQQYPWQAALAMPSITGQTQQTLYGPSPFQELTSGISSLAGPFAMLSMLGVL